MSNERQINYVNGIQNRAQNLYYVDNASEINSIDVKENDKIYAINDNKLFQMEVADQEQTLSGDIVSFNGRNNTKIDSLTVSIEPVQEGTGDPAPDNVRPITGWTVCNVISTGKNLLDYNKLFESGHAGTNWWDYYDFKVPAGTYQLSTNFGGTSTSDAPFGLTYIGGPTSEPVINIYPGHSVQYTFTKATILRVRRRKKGGNYVPTLSMFRNGTIELLLTRNVQDTTFEPYTGNIILINWETEAGTIYGGTVTLNEDGSVDLVSDMLFYSNLAYTIGQYESGNMLKYAVVTMRHPGKTWSNVKMSSFGRAGTSTSTPFNIQERTTTKYHISFPSDWTNDQIDAAMLNFEAIIMGTPQTYHFSDIGQLKTFLGTNNIWSNIGDITVKIAEKGITAFELKPHT